MNLRKTMAIAAKELRQGPRGMMFVWAVFFPLLITFIVRLIFGGLLTPEPRLGVVDEAGSEVARRADENEALAVTFLETEQELRGLVATHDLDAGLILPAGFDDALSAGERPILELFFSGQASADDQLVISVELVDSVRAVAGQSADVTVVQEIVGGGVSVPIEDRVVPLLVLMAVMFAGMLVPAASMLQEKEGGTMTAALVTPTTVGDMLLAKGLIGFILSFGVGGVTLFLNGGVSASSVAAAVVLLVAAFMCVMFGLLVGSVVNNMATMFSVWKAGGIVLFAPAILFLFPGVPEWIGLLFPTYYFLGPLNELVTEGAGLADVWVELVVGAGISVLLVSLVVPLARRMELQLAAS